MAKGKRTVALFEVINKDKRMERKAPAAARPAKSFSRNMAAQAADLWRRKSADPETLTDSSPPLQRKPILIPRLKAFWQAITARIDIATRTIRQWINQQLGALIGGGSAILVISAMLLARHFSTHPSKNLSLEQQLLDGPAHPAVLDGPQQNASANSALSPELAADVVQAKADVPQAPAKPLARIVNINYVLIQSYGDQQTANEACAFLNKNGIACTIERGIKGWRMDFYQVIGLQGFAHTGGPDYATYRKRIKELDGEFAPGGRGYRHFQPLAIKW